MDQLMVGYGVTVSQNTVPPSSFHSQDIAKASGGNMPKKELTLSEKQELAARLEREEPKISSSSSLNSIKHKNNFTDNLMDKNLKDLNFFANQKPNQISSNFDLLSQSMSSTSLMNNQISRQVNSNTSFNSSIGLVRPNVQSNQNQGFFGNLALPAPNSNISPINQSMNTSFNMRPNLTNLNNSINSIPLIPGPPKLGSTLIPKPSNQSVNNGQKSALDDLADIFG